MEAPFLRLITFKILSISNIGRLGFLLPPSDGLKVAEADEPSPRLRTEEA